MNLEIVLQLLKVVMPLIEKIINKEREQRFKDVALYRRLAIEIDTPVLELVTNFALCMSENMSEEEFQSFRNDVNRLQKMNDEYLESKR